MSEPTIPELLEQLQSHDQLIADSAHEEVARRIYAGTSVQMPDDELAVLALVRLSAARGYIVDPGSPESRAALQAQAAGHIADDYSPAEVAAVVDARTADQYSGAQAATQVVAILTAPEVAPGEPKKVVELDLPVADDAEAILAIPDRPIETVQVPQWGMAVRIRAMSGVERDAFDLYLDHSRRKPLEGEDPDEVAFQGFRVALVGAMARKADGTTRLFTDEQIKRLAEKSSAALILLSSRCSELAALMPSDIEALIASLKDVPSDASGTSSPSPSVSAP